MIFGNNCGWLHLEQLIDTPDNELIILISASKSVKPSLSVVENAMSEEIQKLISNTTQMVPDGSQRYMISFKTYIAYQSRNESYASSCDSEVSEGQGLILFEKSKLLDHIHEFVDIDLAMAMHQKTKLLHYGVYTLNNIVDIVTFYEPIIEKK